MELISQLMFYIFAIGRMDRRPCQGGIAVH